MYAEFEASVSNQPPTNFTVDLVCSAVQGLTHTLPTDGVYFRINSSGYFRGVINYNGSETTTSTFVFTFVANKKYRFYYFGYRARSRILD